MVDLPFAAKEIFSRIAKSSKTEGKGERHIPKRIFASVKVNYSSILSGAYFITTLLTCIIGTNSD